MFQITFRKIHIFNNRILNILILSFLSVVSFAEEHIDPYLTAAISSEPSSIVGGCVNSVTGDFVFASTDLIATGEEPSSLNHIYTSRLRNSSFPGGLLLGEHLFIECFYNAIFKITEPSGIQLTYLNHTPNLKGTDEFKHYIESNRILQLTPDSLKGLSNSSNIEISGRVNLKNNKVTYNQNNKSIIIQSSDGSCRYYSARSGYIKDLVDDKYYNSKKKKIIKEQPYYMDFVFKAPHMNFIFKLDKERLSNGNWIFYTYHDNWPIEIKVTNPSMNKTYSRIKTTTGNELICTTSCNKTLKIYGDINVDWPDEIVGWQKTHWKRDKIPIIRGYTYKSKAPPEKPQEIFNYLSPDCKVIQDCILPDKRQLHIDYYTAGNHSVNNTTINIPNTQDSRFMRVKSISVPGKNGNLQNLYYFIYHPGVLDQREGSTEVYDSDGNKTIYKYSAQLRLETIERYILENNEYKKINSEQFVWGKNIESTFLSCKTIYDSKKATSSKHFIYDGKGNLTKEISYGNLSGKCQVPLVIENGFPIMNGIETFSIERAFTNDNRNLLIQQKDNNGLITSFSYQANTDKITSKIISYQDPNQIEGTVDEDVFIGDAEGNIIPVPEGLQLGGSKDGKWIQVKDKDDNPTGLRKDGGGHTQEEDARGKQPHAHVPDISNPDGTPLLPILFF